ncbi:MAG: hypothetical protein N3A54_07075 [Patescibacteria group bacterium]|nr:hypothetical protein [Patescibacteria group bacterium]
MKKKHTLKKKTQTKSSSLVKKLQKKQEEKNEDIYVVLIRSWVFLVLFAFMLGIGVIVGNYINAQINGHPTVAGFSTTR